MTHQPFLQLIERIQTESKNSFEGLQLACITKLVFFCCVLANEIPKLKVGDVIGKDGAINRTIKRGGDREIHLNLAALEAVENYIADLRQKLPSFMHRKASLFPSYRNTDKIKRDLKRFGTNVRVIKEAGYFHYYRNEKSEGTRETRIYEKGAEQLRVTDRQFRAVVTGEKIKPGKTVDTRSIDEILGLLEEAERLDKNAHDAGEKAQNMMDRFEKSLNNIRNNEYRKNYEQVRPHIEKALAPHIK